MKPFDVVELLLVAAAWGAAFPFMRVAEGFGAFPIALTRAVGGALILLLPLLSLRGQWRLLRLHWGPIAVVGVVGSAMPFGLFAYAMAHLESGMAAIFTATTPMWTALVARVWLGERMSWQRVLGLLVGFGGVAWLTSHRSALGGVGDAFGWAILAALGAPALFAASTVYIRRYLAGVPSMAVVGGSQLCAALLLLLPGWWHWPQHSPSLSAWAAVVGLAVVSTGLGYLMFFRLVARLSPSSAVSVTFLVPAFALLWGVLFLDEVVTPTLLVACLVVLVGTALTAGLLERRGAAMPLAQRGGDVA